MSKHLPLLREMFPGEIMLGVEQIAKCLKFSKGHIYNLSSAKKLPFKVQDSSGLVRVSIVELANYMDQSLLSVPPANDAKATPIPAKRGRGRPRGSTTKRLGDLSKAAFQASLRAEILAIEAQELMINLRAMVNAELDAAEAGDRRLTLNAIQASLMASLGASLAHFRGVCEATSPPEPEYGIVEPEKAESPRGSEFPSTESLHEKIQIQ